MKIEPITIKNIQVEDVNISVSEDVVRVSFLNKDGLDIKTVTVKNPDLEVDVNSLVALKLGLTFK